MYAYEPCAINRLLATMDDVKARGNEVHIGNLEELYEAWRDGLPGGGALASPCSAQSPRSPRSHQRRRWHGRATLPVGRIVAVAVRAAGSSTVELLIGEWVLTCEDDALQRRAASAVETLVVKVIQGERGIRQQAVALEWEGTVPVVAQLPRPGIEFLDVGEESVW